MQLQLKNNPNSTAVPNGFIKRCVDAPQKYVSAYLLGLMYAQQQQDTDFDLFCAKLGLSEGDIVEAFEYWQEKGYVRIVNKESICLEFGVFKESEDKADIYTEKEYNIQLQKIFGSRQLSPHDLLKIYDYTDVFHLPKKVVLVLAEYCVLLRGKRVSVSYMDKVAQSWAEEEQIDTTQKARAKIEAYKTASSGVMRVLKQLGIGRKPTKDESALFAKWTGPWDFTLDAILTACAGTTSAREPSMKYLDRILERLKNEGTVTSRHIAERADRRDQQTGDIGALLHILGWHSTKPTFEDENLYHKWTVVYDFDLTVLETAARHASAQGKMPLSYLDEVLTEWYNKGITTAAAAKAHIAAQQAQDHKIAAVFKEAGIAKRRILPAHRQTYARWTREWGICDDAILLAAEISSTRDHPYQYLGAMLTAWHNAGVKTLSDAQRQWQTGFSISQPSAGRMMNERPTENYDHLAVDLFADEGA